MGKIGDGFLGSLGHKHFLKVFIGFAIIVLAVLLWYHSWIKKQVLIEDQWIAQYQAAGQAR